MAAKTAWSREQADQLIGVLSGAFGQGLVYDVSEFIEQVVPCGDVRRDPNASSVKHLCIVGVVRDLPEDASPNLVDIRARVKANVQAVYPGASIRNFKLYDFVELPDGSGNVSWLVIPEAQAGAALLHATGPIQFSEMVDLFASSRGFRFGASGLKSGDQKLVSRTEEDVFRLMEAQFVPAEKRDDARSIDPIG